MNDFTRVGQTAADTVNVSKQALVDSFTQAWSQVILLAPKVVAMAVVLVVGYVVARWVGSLIAVVSEKIGLQTAAEKSGLAKSMNDVGIRRPLPAIVGGIVFWLLMCVFVMAAFNILGLQSISDAMGEVVNYIPRLLVATVVVVIGLLAATFLRGVVATSADRVGLSYAEYLAGGCYWVLSILTFIAAFNQLGIQFALLEKLILIGSAGLAAGFALAFGLGGRDVMAGILSGYYVRQRIQAGDTVSVAGFEGTVREVGPVATIIETRDNGLVSRHSIPNAKMLQEAVR
ncbi:MAG: mechanosensitive ion channel family protein [Planctomycetes bacterium]|nr:mechanosensitive ion channel family protein [Planctomycetota bacterium]